MNHRVIFILFSVLCLSACFNEDQQAADANQPESKASSENVDPTLSQNNLFTNSTQALAKVGNQVITKAQIDKLLELRLFDLEWAAYELRLSALSEEIANLTTAQNPTQTVEVLIEPPMPPRLALGINENLPSYGVKEAPVVLTIFCSYPSSHCARMMPIYQALTEQYQNQVRLEFVDFPQKFHFNAGNAAVAARCAHEHGQFWRYHKGLLARFDELKSEGVFVRMAQQVGIPKENFQNCLTNKKHVDAVEESAHFARSLGLSKVPTTLINGLYVNGPRSLDTLRYYIDKELEQTKIESDSKTLQAASDISEKTIPLSELPLTLKAIQFHSDSTPISATINALLSQQSGVYKEDDEILPNVFLVMIREDNIVIENDGTLEMIKVEERQVASNEPLSKTNQSDSEENLSTEFQSESAMDENSRDAENSKTNTLSKAYLVEPEEIPDDLEYTYRGIVEPKGETPLSKDWIEDQLVYREQLREHFQPAELDVEGYQLMRLTQTNESDFYQTLGLQDKDVIMRVNDQWVHSGQNNLFEKLENEEEVSIVVMRKGLPVHINYAIN